MLLSRSLEDIRLSLFMLTDACDALTVTLEYCALIPRALPHDSLGDAVDSTPWGFLFCLLHFPLGLLRFVFSCFPTPPYLACRARAQGISL